MHINKEFLKKYASFTQYKKIVKMKIWYNNTLRKKIEFILLKSNRENTPTSHNKR